MVSTELLRRYPFFANLTDDQLRKLAMISDEEEFAEGETIFTGGETADYLYLLRDGNIELHFIVSDERGMEETQDHLVGVINPGEVFGISAAVSPYKYTSSAVASAPSQVIQTVGSELRDLCESNIELKALFQEKIAATAFQRLQEARVLLLAGY